MKLVSLSVLLANTGKIGQRWSTPVLLECASHLSCRPLTGPHCFIHTEKGKKMPPRNPTPVRSVFQTSLKGQCRATEVSLFFMLYFLILPLVSASRRNGERGLLVDSGVRLWSETLEWFISLLAVGPCANFSPALSLLGSPEPLKVCFLE